MKNILLILATVLVSLGALAKPNVQLNQCIEICVAESRPGWEIKKCIAGCMQKYGNDNTVLHKALEMVLEKCETYEEDCERGGDDPWGGL